MKNFLSTVIILFLIQSCVSAKKYNAKLEKPISKEKLHQDVDFAYEKLQKLHPNLYWYISKKDLDFKFDSLKTTINSPLKPAGFYQKLAPIVAEIREGHLRLVPPEKMLTKKEIKKLKNQKGLLSRMNYVLENDRLFVKDNSDKFEGIKVGTEILKIKDISIKNYLDDYKKYVNSDGFNSTFQKYSMARRWPIFFTIENGILDSVKIQTLYNNEVKDFYIHRESKTLEEKKVEKKIVATAKKNTTQKNRDYNPLIRAYNRDLQFFEKDSSIAYMKIKTFSGTFSRKFYKESFAKIKRNNSQFLILDVRDNLGGSLSEINNLYSYLALEDFTFINDIEVTSRNSMFSADYFNGLSGVQKPFAGIGYPLYLIGTAFSTKKKDGKIYLRNNTLFTIKKPKETAFKGTIFVLMNGSSFSASSIISSKLKGDKRATLIGEETGGTNDGTVAGRYSTQKLPNSGLRLPIWLMLIQPNIEFGNTQKGVLPDIEILPTLQEILERKDIGFNRVIQEINVIRKK